MGIDIIGISDLLTKPIPKQYRANVTYKEPLKTLDLITSLNKIPSKDRQGIFALTMVMTGAENNFINPNFDMTKSDLNLPPTVDISDESYKWSENEESNANLYRVDWVANNAYYLTPESEKISVGRSYSGFGDFCEKVQEFANAHFYFPCDGTLDTLTCNKYYNLLCSTWKQWKDKYAFESGLSDDINQVDIDKCEDLECDTEFYIKLTKALKYGSESGIVICC